MTQKPIDFSEYKKQGEPSMVEKSGLWEVAIGLQQVDGLTPSEYLIKTARQHIEGDIDIDEVDYRIKEYYKSRPLTPENEQKKEADEVSARITRILAEKTFVFSPAEYINIHKRLFSGVLDGRIVGKIRDYNIEKSEWVLDGDTVYYASADGIRETLDYDFEVEKKFNYKGLNNQEFIEHFAKFVSRIWQIHIFGEGNTRTTAVFVIKYLRTLGYKVDNELFKTYSWYFRNALVRANYTDRKKSIHSTMEYLIRFLENLLFGAKNVLKNRDMHIANKTIKTSDIISDIISDKTSDKLGKTEAEFLRVITSHIEKYGDIDSVAAQEITGKSPQRVRQLFVALVVNGVLVAIGANKGRKYKLAGNK